MSTGEDNKMTISEVAFGQIEPGNMHNYRLLVKEVLAKGKGIMITY